MSLLSDLSEAGGAGLAVVEFDGPGERPIAAPLRVGVQRASGGPSIDPEGFDILLTTDPDAPAPWVGLPPQALDAALERLRLQAEAQPVAAMVAAQVLRATLRLPFDQAVVLESFAYSTLLASEGFRGWLAANPQPKAPHDDAPRVRLSAEEGRLAITLDRPKSRNAFDARMRDELAEALAFALEHPDRPQVLLSGAGATFSVGGDLAEFGSADDAGLAHLIRTLRSPSVLIHSQRERVTAHLHGACIGAGIETPAAAGRVVATRRTWFRLPEVGMGLIPGAGGTASIPRRIGRHRACYMALTGLDVDLATALAWGLVDEVET